MKKEIKKLEELIKETLSKEEAEFYEELEEKNLFGKMTEVYRGKMGWLAIIMNVLHVVFFVLFVICAIRFFEVEAVRELLIWGAGGFICIIFMCMMKLYMWMQMDKNDMMRELKRIELQISVLAHKTNNS